jgi:hypothetical protein
MFGNFAAKVSRKRFLPINFLLTITIPRIGLTHNEFSGNDRSRLLCTHFIPSKE